MHPVVVTKEGQIRFSFLDFHPPPIMSSYKGKGKAKVCWPFLLLVSLTKREAATSEEGDMRLSTQSSKVCAVQQKHDVAGESLASEVNDALVKSVMEQISDKGVATKWTSKNSHSALKSLKTVPVNLRNEIKQLAWAIVLGSWDLSLAIEDQVEDVTAYRRTLVEALLETYDHVDSDMMPFANPAIIQMTQAIIRQFRDYIPINHTDINIDNIIAFAITILRFALQEFSNGTYSPSEFLVENEEETYNAVLQRIKRLDSTDLEFYLIMIQHIFKLI
ncbi:hypothetical protein F4604DRAFT_1920098 [Suillus subluteus]|nr:hypothetical protein F4604DRAFT_1920098 [Suillus subluteus]